MRKRVIRSEIAVCACASGLIRSRMRKRINPPFQDKQNTCLKVLPHFHQIFQVLYKLEMGPKKTNGGGNKGSNGGKSGKGSKTGSKAKMNKERVKEMKQHQEGTSKEQTQEKQTEQKAVEVPCKAKSNISVVSVHQSSLVNEKGKYLSIIFEF